MNGGAPLRVLVSAVNFGFGGAGKLSSIMDCLTGCEFVCVGSSLGRRILDTDRFTTVRGDLSRVELAGVLTEERISAALIALDHELATTIEDLGIPVVFVDSLPHLWTDRDEVAVDVTAYCAQTVPSLPHLAWPTLRRIANLTWVEGIVPAPRPAAARRRPDRHLAIINLGGLESPATTSGSVPYVDVVLPAAVSALADAGYPVVHVTGNVASGVPREVGGVEVVEHCLSHGEMQELIADASLVLTSPGLTMTLELSATDADVVYLPPQNVSQVLLTRMLDDICPAGCAVRWPDGVIDHERFEAARVTGEMAALEVVYGGIARTAGDEAGRRAVAAGIRAGIDARCRHDTSRRLVEVTGDRGARQVADLVVRVATRFSAREG
jgi:hydroxymethylcytosylglucuronate/cytosylglucuronate synthase